MTQVMARRCGAFLLAGVGTLVALSTPAAAGNVSRYTTHEFPRCAPRPSPEPGVIEVTACAGVGGITVIWTSEPDASSVAFGSPFDAASEGLGYFHEVQPVVEWRGPLVDGAMVPVAAIVRYWVGPSIGHLSTSRLAVCRIEPSRRSCLMGLVKEPGANKAARALIDRAAARFVCGKTPRRA